MQLILLQPTFEAKWTVKNQAYPHCTYAPGPGETHEEKQSGIQHYSCPRCIRPRPEEQATGTPLMLLSLLSADLSVILASLQTMRNGDFSVRLPGSWTGLAGKIADTFNSIVAANQQMAEELKRVDR